jgi:hypothetical protein
VLGRLGITKTLAKIYLVVLHWNLNLEAVAAHSVAPNGVSIPPSEILASEFASQTGNCCANPKEKMRRFCDAFRRTGFSSLAA